MKIKNNEPIDYQSALVKKIIYKAVIEGDISAIKLIWEYLESKPKSTIDTAPAELPVPIYGGMAR